MATTETLKVRQAMSRLIKETVHLSAMSGVMNHPAWAEIVAGGEVAVRLMFDDLAKGGKMRHAWYFAIRTILNDGPDIPKEDYGYMDRVREHWVAWGREHSWLA